MEKRFKRGLLIATITMFSLALSSIAQATDCSWVHANIPIKDCMLISGTADAQLKFKGNGNYAIKYQNTPSQSGWNNYRGGASMDHTDFRNIVIRAVDINNVNVEGMYNMTKSNGRIITGVAPESIVQGAVIIYKVSGAPGSRRGSAEGFCLYSGWC